MKLVFGVHNHQPVGNFGWVIERIYERSYLPFLEVLERHPDLRMCLHITGPLLEWLQRERPEYLARVSALVASGRVALLGGGFYEPILIAIPERDRVGQIHLMDDWLLKHLGARSRGVWMAERVWEPHLAGSLHRAGVEFALLDDYHFVQAGIAQDDLTGDPLVTDDLGCDVGLLPISERLRYLIPFRQPEETIAACRELHERDPDGVLVIDDDGEKFGAWPHTYGPVYEQGWLDRFFAALTAESDWLELAHPGEVMDARPGRRRVYLPPSSYFEMSEWTLPMPACETYVRSVEALRAKGEWEAARPFFRGGFWRQFFQKYDESLLMQRRALLLHEEIEAGEVVDGDALRTAEARDHLWRAQCNCAYWHGVFGGLYMPHLREAVYRHLSLGTQIVQSACPAPDVQMVTLLGPLGTDVRLGDGVLDLFLSPSLGGALIGLEDRRLDWNLQNTLRRRREAYHSAMARAPMVEVMPDHEAQGEGEGSIHDLVWPVTREILAAIQEDAQPRWSLMERLLHPGVGAADVLDGMATADGGDFAARPYERLAPRFGVTGALDDPRFRCSRAGRYLAPDGAVQPVTVLKEVTLARGAGGFRAAWELRNTGETQLACRLGVEWNLALFDGATLLVADDGPRNLDREDLPPAAGHRVRVPLHGVDLTWEHSRDAALWVQPVRAATQGEDGFHLTYQGHLLLFVVDLDLAPGATLRFAQEFRIVATQ